MNIEEGNCKIGGHWRVLEEVYSSKLVSLSFVIPTKTGLIRAVNNFRKFNLLLKL
jgi:hypothetical protein